MFESIQWNSAIMWPSSLFSADKSKQICLREWKSFPAITPANGLPLLTEKFEKHTPHTTDQKQHLYRERAMHALAVLASPHLITLLRGRWTCSATQQSIFLIIEYKNQKGLQGILLKKMNLKLWEVKWLARDLTGRFSSLNSKHTMFWHHTVLISIVS